jgi:hypothetical protein
MLISPLASRVRLRAAALLAAAVTLALLPTTALLGQSADVSTRQTASGLTYVDPTINAQVGDAQVVVVNPTLELGLGQTFIIDEESRIFVTLIEATAEPFETGEPRVAHVQRSFDTQEEFEVFVAPASTSGWLSWLVLNTNEITGPPGQACWDLDGSGEPDPFEDRNGDGVVDVLDCQGEQGEQGEQGDPGAAGQACWDDNGNGIGDLPDEDDNGDGVVDLLDCQGEQGEQGVQGEQGEQGEQGPAGQACWDDNGNGIGDLPDEDDNGDGVVDLLDCEGPQGEQGEQGDQGEQGEQGDQGDTGIHCWDLDGDRVNDPEEDTNGDGVFDANDCEGPQGEQGETGPPGPAGGGDFEDVHCPEGTYVTGFDSDGQPTCGTFAGTGWSDGLPCANCEDVYELEFGDTSTVEIALALAPDGEDLTNHAVFDIEANDFIALGNANDVLFFNPEVGKRYAYLIHNSFECGAADPTPSYTVVLNAQSASFVERTADDKRPPTFADLC